MFILYALWSQHGVNLSGWTQREKTFGWSGLIRVTNNNKNIETSEAFEVVSPTQGRGNDWVLIAR